MSHVAQFGKGAIKKLKNSCGMLETPVALGPQSEGTNMKTTTSWSSRLMAASLFTRGLWSPFFAWMHLSKVPFRASSVEWGIDTEFVESKLKRALALASSVTVVEFVLFLMFWKFGLQWLGCLFVLTVLLQWVVFPYFATRKLFEASDAGQAEPTQPRAESIVVSLNDGTISDLGYLFREANFSVDVTKRDSDPIGEESPEKDTLVADCFYGPIEEAFRDDASHITTTRVHVRGSREMHPPQVRWKRWLSPESTLLASEGEVNPRLIVFGENPSVDGIAAVELTIRSVARHLSFRIRLRWIPAMKERIHKLALIAKEKVWWRGGVVPLLLLAVVGIQWFLIALFVLPDKTSLDLEEGVASTFLSFISVSGPMSPAVLIASITAFAPILLAIFVFARRTWRLLHGFAYAFTGTYLDASAAPCHRFALSRTDLDDDESLHWGVSYLQVMEEVVTNKIIEVLHSRGISTQSLREEMRMFVNEGIYMTGGQLSASNLLVGRGGIFNGGRRRRARQGKTSLGHKTSKAN